MAAIEFDGWDDLTKKHPRWAVVLLLWVLAYALLAAMAQLIPPMQSPDEHSHIARAYLVSKGQLNLEAPDGSNSGGAVDVQLVSFWTPYLYTVAASAERHLTAIEVKQLELLRWSDDYQFVELPGTGYYLPTVYAPHAFSLWFGRSLDLSIANTYRLARGCTLLICLCLLAAAVQIYAPNPLVIALMLLPMSLFQMLSPTVDGVTNCTAVFVLSLFMRMQNNMRPIGSLHLLALGVCVFALTTSRAQLMGLLLLPYFVAWKRTSAKAWWTGGIVSLTALGWTWYALHSVVDGRVIRSQSTAELLLRYVEAPWDFIEIVLTTLGDATQFQFYERSFIGILGWLDTALPVVAYPGLWIGLGVCAVASIWTEMKISHLSARGLLVALALASSGLVFLAMLLTWTPHPATLVQGVQGRYFLIPALMLAYALPGGSVTFAGWHGRMRAGGVLAFAAFSLWALITTLASRYH